MKDGEAGDRFTERILQCHEKISVGDSLCDKTQNIIGRIYREESETIQYKIYKPSQ